MLELVFLALIGLTGMWLIIIAVMPPWMKYALARHPYIFLLIHVPVMFAMASIGGEGLIFGIGNLIAGCIAQVVLMAWGMRRHGLTWTGRPGAHFKPYFKKKKKKKGRIKRNLERASLL